MFIVTIHGKVAAMREDHILCTGTDENVAVYFENKRDAVNAINRTIRRAQKYPVLGASRYFYKIFELQQYLKASGV